MKKLLNKRFPTIIGLILLFVSLGAGVFFLDIGPGIFAPRATPQTTPKNVKITNVTDTTLTVSFLTDDQTVGFVKHGTSARSLNTQANDDRDQLSGRVNTYNTHHITIRNLQPNTTYYFTIGTGSNATFDNNGQPYVIKTAQRTSSQSVAQTIYGTVQDTQSAPAEGSIVYVTVEGSSELSTLVRSSGTWAIPLAQLRSADGARAPEVNSNTAMRVFVQGKSANSTATLTTTIGQPQFPVQTIVLGQDATATASVPSPTTVPTVVTTTITQAQGGTTPTPQPTRTAGTTTQPVVSASGSATPTRTLTATPTVRAATPTPDDVSLPATDSPQPVSGSAENTFMILVAGFLLITFGASLTYALRKK